MLRSTLLAFALCSLLVACGDDGDGGDGGDGIDCAQSTLTFENFGEPFISNHCLECHASAVTGAARNNAPASVNFDSRTLVETQAGRIKARVSAGSMPPSTAASTPSQTERSDLSEWIDCGLK